MFGKFFASAFTGSMMAAGPEVFAVWGYVIAHTVDSTVELNPKLLAAVIGSDENRMQAAINQLCSPDPRSRSKNDDGRRLIKEGEYQYRVPNHEKYRSIRDEDGRREYNRLKQQEHRAKVAMSNGSSMTVNESQACQPKQKQKQKQEEHKESIPRVVARGTRLPPDWNPGEAGFAFASKEGLLNGRAEVEVEKFRDYWTAATGQHASKADWQAAWRTWVRKSVEMSGKGSTKSEPAWRTEQRNRVAEFAGPAAAKRPDNMEIVDAVTRILG